ncbi:hypothetical protein RFI_35045 [Reticulomyxa filosa]|uniref:Uncharacterized protein n=1 Tax=Reticulomyxa filosa TaxID=46433 RepID=X6LM34_RETFI|nr:hypothetical protein RFI_35045 [Reticulomyxa filosa]|eukprot:ETO02391.1 hypothetical protein RFI_35045 [Reticulomyxa filosa]
METYPALQRHEVDKDVQKIVYEMERWKDDFVIKMKAPKSEIETFWLRKSFQPILAIVVIQKPNEPIEYFRGVNMEVAMSTGSLCAERNAIGSAFVSDPSIRREYFKMVAVLQMPNLPSTTRMSKLDRELSPQPSGVCV